VVGRDVSEIEISVGVLDTAAPARTLQDADELHELGATLFTLGLNGPDYDISVVPEWLAWRDQKNAE
jgi:hypothetical protein